MGLLYEHSVIGAYFHGNMLAIFLQKINIYPFLVSLCLLFILLYMFLFLFPLMLSRQLLYKVMTTLYLCQCSPFLLSEVDYISAKLVNKK